MRHTFSLTILSILLFIGISACSGSKGKKPAANVDNIETLISKGDFTTAREMADQLCNDTVTGLSSTELCRLSIAYMKLTDNFDPDNNTDITAMATRCYRMAINSDSISATSFYAELPLDESTYVDLMSKLDLQMSADHNTYLDEESSETEYHPADQ